MSTTPSECPVWGICCGMRGYTSKCSVELGLGSGWIWLIPELANWASDPLLISLDLVIGLAASLFVYNCCLLFAITCRLSDTYSSCGVLLEQMKTMRMIAFVPPLVPSWKRKNHTGCTAISASYWPGSKIWFPQTQEGRLGPANLAFLFLNFPLCHPCSNIMIYCFIFGGKNEYVVPSF